MNSEPTADLLNGLICLGGLAPFCLGVLEHTVILDLLPIVN